MATIGNLSIVFMALSTDFFSLGGHHLVLRRKHRTSHEIFVAPLSPETGLVIWGDPWDSNCGISHGLLQEKRKLAVVIRIPCCVVKNIPKIPNTKKNLDLI